MIGTLHHAIIRTTKTHCRRKVCRNVLDKLDQTESRMSATELSKRSSLLDGVLMFNDTWSEVKEQSIRNFWRRVGLTMMEKETEEVPLHEEEWNCWIAIDRNLEIVWPLEEEAIIAATRGSEDKEEEEEVEGDEELPPVTAQKARKAFDTVKRGLIQRGFDHFSLSLEKEMEKNLDKNMTQSSLNRFFNLVPKQ